MRRLAGMEFAVLAASGATPASIGSRAISVQRCNRVGDDATCPVRALKKWLENARVQSGPLFRAVDRHGRVSDEGLHANSIGAIVKRACRTAGYNATEFAGHSLRAGLASQAAAIGVPERLIMRQTRHRSVTTLRRYIRQGCLFRENAAAKMGL